MIKGDNVLEQALVRVLRGEDVAVVAVEMGLAEAKIRQIIDDGTEPGEVKGYLVSMADDLGREGQHECRLTDLEIAGKSYTPDCVWWDHHERAPHERGSRDVYVV